MDLCQSNTFFQSKTCFQLVKQRSNPQLIPLTASTATPTQLISSTPHTQLISSTPHTQLINASPHTQQLISSSPAVMAATALEDIYPKVQVI